MEKFLHSSIQEVVQFLADYPRQGWAFPKEYKDDGTFTYDKEVNLIDQSYVAYHNFRRSFIRCLFGIYKEEIS